MKNKKIVSLAALFVASLASAQAQTTITSWNFDSDYVAPSGSALDYNSSPAPTIGSGTASALGMNNSYNGTNSISNPDILSSAGSSSGTYAWRIRGSSTTVGSEGNGWSSSAAIGSQGAEFTTSTVGFDNIQISFDVDTTAQAERNLQLEYTLNGSVWFNATLTSAGSLGTLETNASSGNAFGSTVVRSYVELGSGWNNEITANLSGIAGVANDANFGIEIVNASTGTNDVNVSGNALNNTSGNWRVDNINITEAVPEPSALALAGLGLMGLVIFRKRSLKV
jgi:hypothetical protein